MVTFYHSSPNQISQSFPDSLRIQGPSKDLALASCIQSLLSKNAIERVEKVKSLGFYNRLFLVHKPHQRWRPVIDLSRLNTFLLEERFKWKEQSPSGPLIPGEWVSSIDLADAYRHIPIHQNSRKYLTQEGIINQKSELKPTQVFSFVSYEYHLDSALVKPTQER